VRHIWLAFIALACSNVASSATLGGLNGAAQLGQPLEVRVPVQWGSDESADNLCIRPEVSFGEASLGGGAFSYSLNVTDARSGTIVIRTRPPVNEPFVSVALHVGCSASFQRRYVLLTDLPDAAAASEPVAAPSAAVPRQVAEIRPAVSTPVQSPAVAGRPEPLVDESPAVERKTGLAMARQIGGDKGSTRAAVVRKADAVAPHGPKLILLPVGVAALPDTDPSLRLSFSLGGEPTDNDQQRQQAAAAWKVLQASVDDQLAMLNRLDELQRLQHSREGLLAEVQSLQARNAELDVQRFNNPLVWVLAALSVVALGAVAWMWRRQRSGVLSAEAAPAWWAVDRGSNPVPDSKMGSGSALTTVQSSLPNSLGADGKPLSVSKVTLPTSRLNPDNVEQKPVSVRPVDAPIEAPMSQPAPLPTFDRRDFMPSLMGVSRSVAAEELLDVQQQADFFVSLGDEEQAIRILRTHIGESAEPSPICYLDLFKIFHKLGQRDNYAALRAEFNEVFNAVAPPFEKFTVQGRGLESFPSALSAISAHWPQPHVLDVIEKFLFRTPGQTDVFDLDACRELLMLYGVAKDIIGNPTLDESFSLRQSAGAPQAVVAPQGSVVVGAAATITMDLELQPMVAPSPHVWGGGQTNQLPTAVSEPEAPKKTAKRDLDVDLDFL
jgi:hypothetical protein